MMLRHNSKTLLWNWFIALLSTLIFWILLLIKFPYSISQYLHSYSPWMFLIVLFLYYLSLRLPEQYGKLISLTLTMALFALTLSYKWTSGYSDNKVIAGFLPYKDGAGYYQGASLILNGLPLTDTLQASWRPLFPGFLSSMLWLMGGNLKWALALLVFLTAVGTYLVFRQTLRVCGAFPASLFITFLYFYVQPYIGLTMTELLGFTMGSLAFLLLWDTSSHVAMSNLVLGLLTLTLALSVRAGTFFMLPFLVLWAGRILRAKKSLSLKALAIALSTVLLSYYIFNSAYVHLIGVPQGTVFGNFAYSLYGQVQGGRGWHFAIESLGTRDPSVIYQAAFKFFLAHPLSLLIGIVKSYRDFFLPVDGSMFAFSINSSSRWLNLIMWGVVIILMVRGLLVLLRTRSLNFSMLLLAGFIGIIFSIPFLPPIDGGSRFYASSAPFFFMIPTMGTVAPRATTIVEEKIQSASYTIPVVQFLVIILSVLTVIMPLAVQKLSSLPTSVPPGCIDGEQGFVIKSYPGSYVDVLPDKNTCGLAPEICFSDFEKNSIEKKVDYFYQKLHSLAKDNQLNGRIVPALNLIDKKLYFFFVPRSKISNPISTGLLSGCAIVINTPNRNIYYVQSINSDGY